MDYCKATSLEHALELLASCNGIPRILAGGTDVMVAMNSKPADPDTSIIYIGDIESLKDIREDGAFLRIGALVTASQLAGSPLVEKYATALGQAAADSAGPQVRNRATIGGNIATASPAGDLICALFALGAELIIQKRGGVVTRPIDEVVTGVKKTALQPDEMIAEIRVPKTHAPHASAFSKMGKRKAMTISIANAACSVELSDGLIADIRIAVGAAAPTVIRVPMVEAALRGKPAEEAVIRSAARQAAQAIAPITDQRATKWYRMEVVPVMVANTIRKAVNQITEAQEVVS